MSGHNSDQTFRMLGLAEEPRMHELSSEHAPNCLVGTKYNSGNGLLFFSILPTKGKSDPDRLFTGQSRSDATRAHSFGYGDASRDRVGACNLAHPDRNFDRMKKVYVHTFEVLTDSMHDREQQPAQPRDFPVPLRPEHSSRAIFIQKTRTQ